MSNLSHALDDECCETRPPRRLHRLIAPFLLALLPKCPLCLSAYMAAVGISGLQILPHRSWLVPLLLFFLAVQLVAVEKRMRRSGLPWGSVRRIAPLVLSLAGTAALLAGSVFGTLPALAFTGAAFVAAGSLAATPRVAAGTAARASSTLRL